MLAPAYQDGRKQDVGLARGLSLQIGGDRKLGDIVFGVSHDRLEQIIGDFDLAKSKSIKSECIAPLFNGTVFG